jgi:predicted Rossmann fold flavoprotein
LTRKDVIIIGAGASGLMCAIEAGKRSRSVLVLDRAKVIGNKIRVSGGGRCNFSNISCNAENYSSLNHHFCKSALARFTPSYFTAMLDRHGIGYHEEDNGRLFCNRSSSKIINMLREECDKAGVQIRLGCRVLDVEKRDLFTVKTDRDTVQTESFVIATGGLSFPKLGATDYGYRLARQFGLGVTPLKPALVPLLFHPGDLKAFRALSGISINASVGCSEKRFSGNILFTHKGLSGPAILQISLYWKKDDSITIDLLPDTDILEFFMEKKESRIRMRSILSRFFPDRFANTWSDFYIHSRPINQCSLKDLKDIARLLHNWEIKPIGTTGYESAEVTLGGVDTDELSSRTMEAKKVAGLYFIGEVIDVTGQLGGYNLHWAWASGFAAGQSL